MWRAFLALFHAGPMALSTQCKTKDEEHAIQAVDELRSTALRAHHATLDLIDAQELDPGRTAMKAGAANLREIMAAVAQRTDRRHS